MNEVEIYRQAIQDAKDALASAEMKPDESLDKEFRREQVFCKDKRNGRKDVCAMRKKPNRRILFILGLGLALGLLTGTTGALAETDPADHTADRNGIPVIRLTIDPEELQKVNNSADHSYRAREGMIRIEIPRDTKGSSERSIRKRRRSIFRWSISAAGAIQPGWKKRSLTNSN